METNPNARFWIYYAPAECCVKVTLRPGQKIEYHSGGLTEEGSHYEWQQYSHENGVIVSRREQRGRDCDGRYSYSNTDICKLENLKAYQNRYTGLNMPLWEDGEYSQRDYSAEAAGY